MKYKSACIIIFVMYTKNVISLIAQRKVTAEK
jgi:hypothetical protein